MTVKSELALSFLWPTPAGITTASPDLKGIAAPFSPQTESQPLPELQSGLHAYCCDNDGMEKHSPTSCLTSHAG